MRPLVTALLILFRKLQIRNVTWSLSFITQASLLLTKIFFSHQVVIVEQK